MCNPISRIYPYILLTIRAWVHQLNWFLSLAVANVVKGHGPRIVRVENVVWRLVLKCDFGPEFHVIATQHKGRRLLLTDREANLQGRRG